MNLIQRSVVRFLKAVGFPIWTGSTTDIPPGGWGAWDWGSDRIKALELAAVFGCCRVLAGTIGSLPFHVYREAKDGTRTKATDHPIYPLLHDRPNIYQSSMDFRQALVLGYCLFGNGFAEIVRSGKRVTSLIPMRADRVRVILDAQGLRYEYYGNDGKQETYLPDRVLHIRNFSLDGINGISPLRPDVVNHGLIAQTYGRIFLQNGARPAGTLTMPKGTKLEDIERVKNDWKKLHQGAEKAGSVAVLYDGMTYAEMGFNPEQSQYIETLEMITKQVAACYGVPLPFLMINDKTASFASSEQVDIQFGKHVVRPLAENIEQSFNRSLFALEPNTFCEMDMDALMRGDSTAQAEWFRKMAASGFISSDEGRQKLNLPLRGGPADELRVQANEVMLKDLPRLSAAATPQMSPGDIRKGAPADEI